jgi:thiosulfate dehydrogenase [quinone] large subunit
MALFPLRLFLGITFVYAGVQKLSDPGFLHAGASTYIGTQLEGFARGTPGGFVLETFALPHPELAGIGVAIVEILVGLLVTAGFLTRIAAAVGMCLNFFLFLTASWHTTPYFLGPDLVFTFAWLPLVLAGSEGQPALENVVRRPSPALARRISLHPEALEGMDEGAAVRSTRRVLLLEFGGAALAIAGIATLFKGPYKAPRTLSAGGKGGKAASGSGSGSGAGNGGGGGGGAQGASSSGASLPSGAVKLGPANRLPAESAATYTDPTEGTPDIIIREADGSLKAFSAVCTHAGCTVGYEGGVIICPCHGGEYSAESGEVIAGPPPAGLAPKQVLESGGQIYAVPS